MEDGMTEALRTIIAETQTAFQADPESAKATFTSISELQDGLQTVASMRQHNVTVDEPEALGGADTGPNPVELVLAALGTCQEITYRAYATAMGISLDGVSVAVEGDIDLRGFFAVDDSVRAGYEKIRATVTLDSNASEAELQQLREAVNAHCPVLDILTGKVPVDISMKSVRVAVAAE